MSPNRAVLAVLLVVFAGCSGASPGGATTSTTDFPTDTATQTTAPHTGVGTSHAPEHFHVRAGGETSNVTVTLAPNGDTETYRLDSGRQLDLTREIHDRGHDTTVVVERGNETVFDETVAGYEYYELTVYENDTNVEQAMV